MLAKNSFQLGGAKSRKCLALCFISTFLISTGCMTTAHQWRQQGFKVGPNYSRPDAEVSPEWLDDDPAIVSAPIEFAEWWAVFDDPILNTLIESVEYDNLQLKSAAARINGARALTHVARSTLFPQIQAGGAFSHAENSESTAIVFPDTEFDTWSTGFNASWELDLWGRLRRAVDASDANFCANLENRNAILVTLQGEVANAYLQMRTLQARLEILHRNQELQEQTLDLAQTRFDNGKVSELDVAQAKVNLNATRAAVPSVEEAIRKAQNGLCLLLGRPPLSLDDELGVAAIPTPPESVVVGIPADLLRRRPDVRAAERTVKIRSELVGISEASLYPTIALTGSIGLESESLSSLFQSNSITNSIGPNFQWNILTFGRQKNLLKQSKAQLCEAIFDYRNLVLAANREVEDGIISFRKERERLEHLRETVVAAERSVQLANLQYTEGKVNFQRVIDTQRVLLLQQDELTASQGKVNIDLVTVYRALGGGWEASARTSRGKNVTHSSQEFLQKIASPADQSDEPKDKFVIAEN